MLPVVKLLYFHLFEFFCSDYCNRLTGQFILCDHNVRICVQDRLGLNYPDRADSVLIQMKLLLVPEKGYTRQKISSLNRISFGLILFNILIFSSSKSFRQNKTGHNLTVVACFLMLYN